MKVILKERVPALGNVGEVVTVSSGYGRNYLIPNELAVLADDSNKKELENNKRRLKKKVDAEVNKAQEFKKKLHQKTLAFEKRVGANGKLFGTVTTADLAVELAKDGIEIERRLLSVDRPIKAVGEYVVKVKLFAEVEAEFYVKITMDPKQVEEMKAQEEENKKAKKKAREEKAAAAAAAEAEQSSENQVEA